MVKNGLRRFVFKAILFISLLSILFFYGCTTDSKERPPLTNSDCNGELKYSEEYVCHSLQTIIWEELAKKYNIDLKNHNTISQEAQDNWLLPIKKDIEVISGPIIAADQILDYYLYPETTPEIVGNHWLKDISDNFEINCQPSPLLIEDALQLLKQKWCEKGRPLIQELETNAVISKFIQEVDHAFNIAFEGTQDDFLHAHAYFHDFSLLLCGESPTYHVSETETLAGTTQITIPLCTEMEKKQKPIQLPQINLLLNKTKEQVEQLLGGPSWYGPFTKGVRLRDSGQVVEAYQGKYSFEDDEEPIWVSGKTIIIDYIDGVSRRIEISLPATVDYPSWKSPKDSSRILSYFGLSLPGDKEPEERFNYSDSATYTNTCSYWRVIVGGNSKGQETIWICITTDQKYRNSNWY